MDGNTSVRQSGYGFWFWSIGLLFSSLSFISLCQKLLGIGLVPVLEEFLGFYRNAVHPPIDYILGIAGVTPADWYKDAFMLSFVACAPIGRAGYSRITAGSSATRKVILGAIVAVVALLLSASLLGLLQPMGALANIGAGAITPGKRVTFDYRVSVDALTLFAGMIAAAVVFFAFNSQL